MGGNSLPFQVKGCGEGEAQRESLMEVEGDCKKRIRDGIPAQDLLGRRPYLSEQGRREEERGGTVEQLARVWVSLWVKWTPW
jgi:hypothetical protein